ncbi:MAG: hypothetical protein ABIN57_09855 [Chitinophagaceae bacterium]
MEKDNNDPSRNKAAEKGRKNDPDLRDDSAIQPGVQTISESPTDESNSSPTKTSSGSFGEDTSNDGADASFDDNLTEG